MRATFFIAALAVGIGALIACDAASATAKTMRSLTGAQIRASFTGKQLTDEVHYRLVYDPDGTLRSYSMGVKKIGKWNIAKDELCLGLGENDDGCFRHVERRTGRPDADRSRRTVRRHFAAGIS
ncbi:hypothetical protein [Bradyrhizobium sp. WSM2793]|uniref:hypothetical protein n=1 Tax=Bradyrhizobium sp. WSM2793 TaxID=1038866 RepID=UPI0012F928C8|nr:hypothetical protein [Bradyrhizobium sp. WSM2793]